MKKDPRHRARGVGAQAVERLQRVGPAQVHHHEVGAARRLQEPGGVARGDRAPPETVSRLADADALIADTAERWRPERMAVIDRLILRLSVTELLRQQGPPPAVIINEALELARTFSTEEAVKFINGMLDAIRRRIESEKSKEKS